MALNPDGMAYFLGMLFDKEVTVTQIESKPLNRDDKVAICTYRDNTGTPVAGCLFDFPIACYSSAALSMIPAGAAEDAIESVEIPESLQENLHEVFNVAVGFFGNGKIGPNLRLHEMSIYPPSSGDDLAGQISKIAARKDYHIDIKGYGKGDMTLFLMG